MRLSSFVSLLIGACFVGFAGTVAAQPKSSQFTLSGNVRDAGGHASTIFLHSLDGDLQKTGPLVRLSFGDGKSRQSVNNELSTTSASVLAGYQIVAPMMRTRLFAGLDVKNRDFSIGGAGDGTEAGTVVMVQLSQGREAAIKFDVNAGYTTAHNAYNLLARVSWPVGDINVGPEFAVLGSDHDRSTRVGVALSDWRLGPVNATFRAGYAFGSDDESSGDSPFLALSLTRQF